MDSIEYLPVPCHYCCYSRNMPVDRAHIYIINTSRCILYGCLCQFILFLQPPNLKVFGISFPFYLSGWDLSFMQVGGSLLPAGTLKYATSPTSVFTWRCFNKWDVEGWMTLWRRNFSHFLIQCPVSLVYYEFWSCSVTGRTKIFRCNRPIIKLFSFFLAVSCLFVHLSETHGDSDNAWKRDKTMSVKIDAPLTWKKQP